MRGFIRKVLGLSLLGSLLVMPVLLAQRSTGGGRKGGSKKAGSKKGKSGSKAPAKGGRGGN